MPQSSGSKNNPSSQRAHLAWHYIPQDKTHSHHNENHISDNVNVHSGLPVALYMIG
jgi:hypothetical protein